MLASLGRYSTDSTGRIVRGGGMSLPERVATDPTAYARPGKIRWQVFILCMRPSAPGRRLAAQGQWAATPDRTQRPGQMETRRQSYMLRAASIYLPPGMAFSRLTSLRSTGCGLPPVVEAPGATPGPAVLS